VLISKAPSEWTEREKMMPTITFGCKCGKSDWTISLCSLEGATEWICECGRWWVSFQQGDGCVIRIEPMPNKVLIQQE
jgi:hypothetical protein